MFAKILLAASILFCASPALADKRIYKVDSLIATQKDGKVVVEARGAVQTGGWKNPRLRAIPGDGNRTLTIEFVANAPPSSMVVIDALMPVTASAEFKAHGKGSVRVIATANEMTTQILK